MINGEVEVEKLDDGLPDGPLFFSPLFFHGAGNPFGVTLPTFTVTFPNFLAVRLMYDKLDFFLG